ncbi:halocin C8 precursor-like protein [Staphylococcus equorum]|uniref:halocin C8 precursor-like protein n=1 Tax=Staphylococcus equorum TaxID=246432 RepID=UPI003D807904
MRKFLFSFLSLVLVISFSIIPFFQQAHAASEGVHKTKSNVSTKTKKKIINIIKTSKEYKEYATSTSIDSINDENVIVHLNKGENTNVYSINYIFGKNLAKQNNNLAMVELKYNEANGKVFYAHSMYTKFVKHNGNQFVNLQGVLNNKPYYNFNLGKDGKLYNENFKVSSKKEIEADSYKNLPHKERGWCEWAVGSLCGTGGAGGCWAVALGITTGLGGFGIATICGLITSLGCIGATNYICS